LNNKLEKQNKVAIIQARSGSTRLPRKIFKALAGKPMIWHVVDRLSHAKMLDKIIIATTTQSEDDQVVGFCSANNIFCYRGSLNDVLSRYYETAKNYNADIVIRITSDCPVLDPDIIDAMLIQFIQEDHIDYLSNTLERTFPRGLDTEIFTFAALEKTFNEAKLDYEHEHVTPYIYNNSELFTIKNYANETDLSSYRWTVDTPEDLRLIEEIYNSLYQKDKIFLFKDILQLIEKRPELAKINQEIKQKKLGE
jgi:spore coat polysaccharide biosynthesis protein SpsF